jgi:DUF4097 and DUF4098 domain-containing protein YvlB
MESKNRGVWIFVLVVVVALALMSCCLVAAAGAIGVPVFVRSLIPESVNWSWPHEPVELPGLELSERMEESFEVGSAPSLSIDSFAGGVTIRVGDEGTVRVVATKKATSRSRLDAIEVEMSAGASEVKITTRHPSLSSVSNLSVDLEITVPADTSVDLETGAGAIDVRGVRGALNIEAGAGGVEIRDAAGPVRVAVGAGGIDYDGDPSGECTFRAGAGGITLRIPADASLEVDLSAGLGGVRSDLRVSGTVTRRSVHGTIGTGSQGSIMATAGVGGIELVRR